VPFSASLAGNLVTIQFIRYVSVTEALPTELTYTFQDGSFFVVRNQHTAHYIEPIGRVVVYLAVRSLVMQRRRYMRPACVVVNFMAIHNE
jgi:hypothetical protein